MNKRERKETKEELFGDILKESDVAFSYVIHIEKTLENLRGFYRLRLIVLNCVNLDLSSLRHENNHIIIYFCGWMGTMFILIF